LSSATLRHPPRPTRFPYTTLFRSMGRRRGRFRGLAAVAAACAVLTVPACEAPPGAAPGDRARLADVAGRLDALEAAVTQAEDVRSEEHTSELQSREKLVCRLLLEK